MKKVSIFLGLAISILLTACGGGSGGSGDGVTSSNTVLINDKTPREYYDQFLYKVTGSCEEKYLQFYYLTSNEVVLRKNQEGFPLYGAIDIYLTGQNTFEARYEERQVAKWRSSGYEYNVMAKKVLKGSYSVSAEGRIEFQKLAVGRSLKYNGSDVIDLTFTNPIIDENLVGGTTILRMVSSSGGGRIGHESFNEYCNIK